MEEVAAYFKLNSWYLSGQTQDCHEKLSQAICAQLGFKPVTSWMWVRYITTIPECLLSKIYQFSPQLDDEIFYSNQSVFCIVKFIIRLISTDLLKPWEHCEKWEKDVDLNPDTVKEMYEFQRSDIMNSLLQNVSLRLGFDRTLTIGMYTLNLMANVR